VPVHQPQGGTAQPRRGRCTQQALAPHQDIHGAPRVRFVAAKSARHELHRVHAGVLQRVRRPHLWAQIVVHRPFAH
jgi:hypothetical protein